MRQVSVVRFARRTIATTALRTIVTTAAIQGIANAGQQAREVSVSPVAQAPTAPAPAPVIVVEVEQSQRWIVTGFVGSGFSANGDLAFDATDTADGGVTFGGQIARMWGYVGAEFLADFQPSFKVASLALSEHPTVNSYMLNVIAKGGLGAESRFQAYASGGLGWISMRTSTFTVIGDTFNNPTLGTVNNTQSKFGSDLGGGVFVFANKWGIRGDIRYYDASTFDTEKLQNGTFANDFTQALLSGLSFWRANLGVAYRW